MTVHHAGSLTLGDQLVPRFGYGTMRLTGPRIFGPPSDRAEAVRVLRRAVDAGVRVIDAAWYYGPHVAHQIIREALFPYPDDLVLVTKLGGARRDDASWYAALSPEELRKGCEDDLRLLGLDAVPVTHLRWMGDDGASFEAAVETMLELQREGKIRHLGLSNVGAAQIDEVRRGTPVVSVSNAFSLLKRDDEPVVAYCEREGIAYLPFFPLAATPGGSSGIADSDPLARVAARLEATPAQVALAWLLARSPVILPIPGTSSVAHLEENLAAADLQLSAGDVAQLDGLAG
jgi:aryl-alcohol dehydrogenase-like predicted oxidoreductase